MNKILKLSFGFCPCCEKKTLFKANDYNYREFYQCIRCHSNPRQRALTQIISELKPNWQLSKIHESSPCGPTFQKMLNHCKGYTYSFFYPNKELGCFLENHQNATNQNLQSLTFPNESFDIFITQDVLEHINDPYEAIKEIYRCLKPGGMHIFTVPVSPFQSTTPRIKIENGVAIPTLPEIYHGNPISEKGSLVTYDWGGDICKIIDATSNFHTEVKQISPSKENYYYGIDVTQLFIFVSTKIG